MLSGEKFKLQNKWGSGSFHTFHAFHTLEIKPWRTSGLNWEYAADLVEALRSTEWRHIYYKSNQHLKRLIRHWVDQNLKPNQKPASKMERSTIRMQAAVTLINEFEVDMEKHLCSMLIVG